MYTLTEKNDPVKWEEFKNGAPKEVQLLVEIYRSKTLSLLERFDETFSSFSNRITSSNKREYEDWIENFAKKAVVDITKTDSIAVSNTVFSSNVLIKMKENYYLVKCNCESTSEKENLQVEELHGSVKFQETKELLEKDLLDKQSLCNILTYARSYTVVPLVYSALERMKALDLHVYVNRANVYVDSTTRCLILREKSTITGILNFLKKATALTDQERDTLVRLLMSLGGSVDEDRELISAIYEAFERCNIPTFKICVDYLSNDNQYDKAVSPQKLLALLKTTPIEEPSLLPKLEKIMCQITTLPDLKEEINFAILQYWEKRQNQDAIIKHLSLNGAPAPSVQSMKLLDKIADNYSKDLSETFLGRMLGGSAEETLEESNSKQLLKKICAKVNEGIIVEQKQSVKFSLINELKNPDVKVVAFSALSNDAKGSFIEEGNAMLPAFWALTSSEILNKNKQKFIDSLDHIPKDTDILQKIQQMHGLEQGIKDAIAKKLNLV